MNATDHVLWRSEHAGPIVARVAVAGDFLPAGRIELPAIGGWQAAAASLAPHFADVAISFANLECVLNAQGLRATPLCGLGDIVSSPAAAIGYLEAIRAQAVGIANNHTYDFGAEGVARTREALETRGLTPLGTGRTLRVDAEVHIWQGQKIRVGFWAAANASRQLATRNSAGVEPATVARAKRALGEIRARGGHIAIALLHAGIQRTNRPDPADVKLVDSIARCGFHLVAASHSHRICGFRAIRVRRDQPAFSFYGLGSIASGYISSPEEREGLIVVAGLDARGDLAQIEVRPVIIGENGFGQVPSPVMAGSILGRFQAFSHELKDGSSSRFFYRDISRDLVGLYVRDARAAFRASGIRGLVHKAGRLRMRHVRRLAHRLIS